MLASPRLKTTDYSEEVFGQCLQERMTVIAEPGTAGTKVSLVMVLLPLKGGLFHCSAAKASAVHGIVFWTFWHWKNHLVADPKGNSLEMMSTG